MAQDSITKKGITRKRATTEVHRSEYSYRPWTKEEVIWTPLQLKRIDDALIVRGD